MRDDSQVPGCTELPEAEGGGGESRDGVLSPSSSLVGVAALITGREGRDGMAVPSCKGCWVGILPSVPASLPDIPERWREAASLWSSSTFSTSAVDTLEGRWRGEECLWHQAGSEEQWVSSLFLLFFGVLPCTILGKLRVVPFVVCEE